jgi:hypothetical protein
MKRRHAVSIHLDACPICRAVVRIVDMDAHVEWHAPNVVERIEQATQAPGELR